MPGRHNKATARDDYLTASRLGIIKPPWPQGRGRPWQLGRRRGFSARVQSSAESRGSLPRTWNKTLRLGLGATAGRHSRHSAL